MEEPITDEHILNLAGFTPDEWREFKKDVAAKSKFYWQRVQRELTPARVGGAFLVLLIGGLVLFGIQKGSEYFSQEDDGIVRRPRESTESAIPGRDKERLEIALEELGKELETVSKISADLEYPSLDLEVSFE